MNSKLLTYAAVAIAAVATGCSQGVDIEGYVNEQAPIYPDYIGVTVPCNIAPLNFCIDDSSDIAVHLVTPSDSTWVRASDGNVEIPAKWWRNALDGCKGDSMRITVCRRIDDRWMAYQPFAIAVSPDSISSTLAYRLIPPLYGVWRHMGIYQRDLEGFDQDAIYENDALSGNCVNCHSFCARQPDAMLFHLRGKAGATYLCKPDLQLKLDTKTDSAVSNFVYPYWHPDADHVAFSVNKTFQVFHNADPNRVEVLDDASDIIVYDIPRNRVLTSPLISMPDRLETFPAFSPDGKTLYFCSAQLPERLPEQFRDVRYSLLSIGFDAATGTFADHVDTLYCATDSTMSVSFPRPSPDGRWLAATLHGFGTFSIWHKDADLWILDLQNGEWQPLTAANSDDVDSYHSWSGNSRWMVFSSRRENGLYTRPYFTHIGDDGKASKPFLLPQRNPKKYYADQMNSFNIPELVDGRISVTTHDVTKWAESPAKKVK